MSDQAVRDNYKALGLQIIEQMYTPDYLSIGGTASTDDLVALAGIDAQSTVLDVGCGLGGPAMHIAATTGCSMVGMDLLQLSVSQATVPPGDRLTIATTTHPPDPMPCSSASTILNCLPRHPSAS